MTGIGIDDMFVILNALDHARVGENSTIENRIGTALRKSGVAILITTVTDVYALCIGIFTVQKT